MVYILATQANYSIEIAKTPFKILMYREVNTMENDYFAEYEKQYQNDEFEKDLVSIRKNNVLSTISKYPHKRILEVGCGFEPLFQHIEKYDFFVVIDPVKHFIESAKKLGKTKNNIKFINAEIENAFDDLKEYKFDIILVSSLLHEVKNPGGIMEVLYRICTKETICYIDVPNVYSFHRMLGVAMGKLKNINCFTDMDYRFGRNHHFNKESLSKFVSSYGFKVLKNWTYFIKPFSSEQMAQMLKYNIIDYSVIRGLENLSKDFPENGSLLAMEIIKE